MRQFHHKARSVQLVAQSAVRFSDNIDDLESGVRKSVYRKSDTTNFKYYFIINDNTRVYYYKLLSQDQLNNKYFSIVEYSNT